MNRMASLYDEYGGLLVGAISFVLALATFAVVVREPEGTFFLAYVSMVAAIGFTWLFAALVGEVYYDE